MPNLWITYPKPDPQASIRLFCFPYAGAGSSIYQRWTGSLAGIELGLINLPGRDARVHEPLQTSMVTLAAQICENIMPHLDRPFAFFGHSMGGLLAFEVARQLRRQKAPQPAHLIISSRRAPHLPDPTAHFWRMSKTEFLATIERLYGALPALIRQDEDILNMFLSIMQADFTMMGTYQFCPEEPFTFPLTVLGGQHDPSVRENDLQGWKQLAGADFEVILFPGDHFYFQKTPLPFFDVLRRKLSLAA